MQLYFSITSPHQWVTLDHKGEVDSGVAEGLDSLPFNVTYHRVVAVAPGEQVVTRTVTIPVKNRQKLLAAIPYAVEDSLIDAVDDLHFVLLNTDGDNLVTFSYIAKHVIDGWLELINQSGIQVDALMPDYLLLPTPEVDSTMLVQTDPGRLLIRSGKYLGSVVDEETLPAWIQEHGSEASVQAGDHSLAERLASYGLSSISERPVGARLVEWLREEVPDDSPCLMQNDYQTAREKAGLNRYRAVAAIILLAVLVKIAGDVAELNWLTRTHERLDEKAATLYQNLFPGTKLIPGKARVQMKNRVDELRLQHGRSEFTALLSSTGKLLKKAGVNVEELQYRKNILIAVCTMRDFSHLDKVKQVLQKDASINAKLVQSGAKGNKVQARFEITGKST